ncbi:unnamed protein product [Protopolystoma xenopodis]|uniref:Uncharacterized protein n=1 Tax=Protopolystoma xenopodis TaxID=117903 RepID=A0A3S5C7E4_9PLAT|nr:unnamed protein product [Protopolystoma xenopodis]
MVSVFLAGLNDRGVLPYFPNFSQSQSIILPEVPALGTLGDYEMQTLGSQRNKSPDKRSDVTIEEAMHSAVISA